MEIVISNFNYLKYKIEFCKQEEWFKWLKIFSNIDLESSSYLQSYSRPSLHSYITQDYSIDTTYYCNAISPSTMYTSVYDVADVYTWYIFKGKLSNSNLTCIHTSSTLDSTSELKYFSGRPLYTETAPVFYKVLNSEHYANVLIGNFTLAYLSTTTESYLNSVEDVNVNASDAMHLETDSSAYTTYNLTATLYVPANINKISTFNSYTLNSLSSYNLFELSYSNF